METVEVPLFPWQTVLFPGTYFPIRVSEGPHAAAVHHCLAHGTPLGVILVEVVGAGQGILAEVGTLATLQDAVDHEDGSVETLGVGRQRFRIRRIVGDTPFLAAEAELLADAEVQHASDSEVDATLRSVTRRFHQYASLALPQVPGNVEVQLPSERVERLNLICSAVLVPLRQKQRLLEEDSLIRRAELAETILHRETTELASYRAAMDILQGEEPHLPPPYPFSRN